MRPRGTWVVLLLCLASAGGCSDSPRVKEAIVLSGSLKEIVERPRQTDSLCLDTDRSMVRWRGKKIGGSHEGTVRLKAGILELQGSTVVQGAVVADMRSIAVTDIPAHEREARENLRSHLAHEEFFGVERFPTARFVLTEVKEPDGGGRRSVVGRLTIRDSTHAISFPLTASMESRDEAMARAAFSFDRNRWGIDFDGATSILRNAIVHDLIELEVTIRGTREACGPSIQREPSFSG